MINELVKLADTLDRKGMAGESDLVDKVVSKIAACGDSNEERWHDFGGPDEIYDILKGEKPPGPHGWREDKDGPPETLPEKVERLIGELQEVKQELHGEHDEVIDSYSSKTINDLIKLATHLDNNGLPEEADYLDAVIRKYVRH